MVRVSSKKIGVEYMIRKTNLDIHYGQIFNTKTFDKVYILL